MEGKLKLDMEIKEFENIPSDQYEIISIVQNKKGTNIHLIGLDYSLEVHFGSIGCICICDEGCRIESYNNKIIEKITKYQSNKFYGNPIFVSKSENEFTNWLKKESCGFSESLIHYLIITINDYVDIASPFPPKIKIKQIIRNK